MQTDTIIPKTYTVCNSSLQCNSRFKALDDLTLQGAPVRSFEEAHPGSRQGTKERISHLLQVPQFLL